MFEDYKKEVILVYHKKREEGTLSSHLAHPSPAQLRTECLKVYNERYSPEDESILRSFFGPESLESNYRQLIERIDPDKFRPLVNLLKDRIKDPRHSNIELLAWLIDFNPRPHALWEKKVGQKGGGDSIPPKVDRWAKFKTKKAMISYVVFLVLGIGFWFTVIADPFPQCMYWAGDHYEPVSCSDKIENADVIALDEARVANLKKITRPDTLSENSIGKVWYAPKGKDPDFYTAGGRNPEDANKRLLRMSKYIWIKYVRDKYPKKL